jgi:uncharacterized phage protein gp47/JayE
MPFARPTPQDIRDRIGVEIEAAIPGADARLRRTVETVIARMLALASHEMHGHLAWIARQILVDTAEAEVLERHAAIWGIARTSGASAEGAARFVANDGAFIPAGAVLRRADGAEFTATATGEAEDGSILLAVRAASTGAAGNTLAGEALALAVAVAGVSASGAAEGDISGGIDAEDDASLRARVIERIQLPPHGGAAHDYTAWAKQVAGVTRVWVYPGQLGLGTVELLFVMDDEDDIFPDADKVQEVADLIETVRPVTADVTVIAPTPQAVNFSISVSPNTADIRAGIEAALADFLARDGEPGGMLWRSRISEAISLAPGEFHHQLIAPATDLSFSFGRLPVLGTITWSGG